ncbi:MAG: FKBP-type peptidyl-prolyl cis-trans isomerase [Gemmatirosa sp.]|nr:FKBP-type peptidyl-prolyl cis-trans isomerase [Gemmatirosa sp.]
MLTLGALAVCTREGGDKTDKSAPATSSAAVSPDPLQNTYAPALGVTAQSLQGFFKTPRGVYYQDAQVGTGTVAIAGRQAKVRYAGYLPNGTKFDAGDYTFTIGAGEVIAGWDEGIAGMKVGGKRKLVIPAALGYGASGSPPDIPPNATLVFDTELLEVP